MPRQSLSPKDTAIALGATLVALMVLIGGYRLLHTRATQAQETQMEWQRDREMGVPIVSVSENATAEEKEVARTKALEKKLTREREGISTALSAP